MKNQYSLDVLKNSHKGCFKNKEELLNYENCGCFLCLNIFKTKEFADFTVEFIIVNGKVTAVKQKDGSGEYVIQKDDN